MVAAAFGARVGQTLAGGGGAQTNPMQTFGDFARAMSTLNQVRMQNAEWAARNQASDIMSRYQTLDDAMPEMIRSGIGAFIPEVVTNMAHTNQSLVATAGQRDEQFTNAMNRWYKQQSELYTAATSGDPQVISQTASNLVARTLEGINDPNVARRAGGAMTDALTSVLAQARRPDGSIDPQKLQTAILSQVTGHLTPEEQDNLRGTRYGPAAGYTPLAPGLTLAPPGGPQPPPAPFGQESVPPGGALAPPPPTTTPPPTGPQYGPGAVARTDLSPPPAATAASGTAAGASPPAATTPPPTTPPPAATTTPPPAQRAPGTSLRDSYDGTPLWTNESFAGGTAGQTDRAGNPIGPGAGLYADFQGKERDAYNNAVGASGQLESIQLDLDRLARAGHGLLTPGAFASERLQIGRLLDTVGRVFGVKESDLPVPPDQIASAESWTKNTRWLAQQLQSQYTGHQRLAGDQINQDMAATPAFDQTPLGASLVLEGMRATNQRALDERDFKQEWARRYNGNLTGAEEAFARTHPTQRYVDQAFSKFGMGPDGKFQSPEAAGAIFNRGLIDEQTFRRILHSQFQIN